MPGGAPQTILWFCDHPGRGHRLSPALGTLPRPVHVSSPGSPGRAWAGHWQQAEDARGRSQRRWSDAQSPSRHPARPCCSPWLRGRCQLPKHQHTTHFSKGKVLTVPRVLRALPFAHCQPGGGCTGACRAEDGWDWPQTVPQPSLGSSWLPSPWLMAQQCQPSVASLGSARACPGRSRSPPPAEQSQTPEYSKQEKLSFCYKSKRHKQTVNPTGLGQAWLLHSALSPGEAAQGAGAPSLRTSAVLG